MTKEESFLMWLLFLLAGANFMEFGDGEGNETRNSSRKTVRQEPPKKHTPSSSSIKYHAGM